MKTGTLRNAVLVCSTLMLLGAGSSAIAATSVKGIKNCENALIEKSKFKGLPMAAFSVRPGRDDEHAHFTVRWDGLNSSGHCIVDKHGKVKEIEIVEFDDGRKGNKGGDTRTTEAVSITIHTWVNGVIRMAVFVTRVPRKTDFPSLRNTVNKSWPGQVRSS